VREGGTSLMKSFLGRLLYNVLLYGGALIGLMLIALLVLAAGKERQRTVHGFCPNYECLAAILTPRDSGIHKGALSQVPKEALDIQYSFLAYNGLLEFTFTLDEQEFIEWTLQLGWSRDTIMANHRGGSLLFQILKSGDHFENVQIKSGYCLESRIDGRDYRTIGYDDQSRIAYLQIWTPLPAQMHNRGYWTDD
jgi:hypothetical protein